MAASHPGVETEKYHTLGHKTFLIFLLQRIHASFVCLLLAVGLFVLAGQPFLATSPLGNIANYVTEAAWIFLALFFIVFLITYFVAWLIYANYKFFLGVDSLKIKRGILNKEEVAIPYRQIQDVDIERDLTFQMMGLSRLMILTAGREDVGVSPKDDDDSEGVLPAMDRTLAEWLQAELLKRANVQKVVEEKT